MRLRNIPGADDVIEKSPYVIQQPESYKGKMNENFEKSQPLCVEIGMGKGRFIIEQARQNPDKNFIGIEMYSSVLLRAVQKLMAMEQEGEVLPNLKLILFDAKKITDIFDNEEVDLIFLNFSDPWPKKRHNKRRLTYPTMLEEYAKVLKKDGKLIFKSDNDTLFNDSLEYLKDSPFEIESVTFDYDGLDEYDAPTEYEKKFRSEGVKIKRLIAKLK